jgi:putative membrane protein
MDMTHLVKGVIESLVFVLIGIVTFGVAFLVITKVTPFSIRKEIEEDQNVALGIVIGSVFIGLALVIAAAIGGGGVK